MPDSTPSPRANSLQPLSLLTDRLAGDLAERRFAAEPGATPTSTPEDGATYRLDPDACVLPGRPCYGVSLTPPDSGRPVRFCACPDGLHSRAKFERGLALDFREAGVPDRLAGCTLDSAADIHADRPGTQPALDAAHRFVGRYLEGFAPRAGLVLTGPVGTGKSGLLAALTHAVQALGVPVLWYTYAGLVAAVQEHYGSGRADVRQINAERAPVLVLDDLGDPYRIRGDSQETEDRRRIVHAVVSARAAAFRPTLVSANYDSLNDLAQQFDPRIADRLRESCERHTLAGASLRTSPTI